MKVYTKKVLLALMLTAVCQISLSEIVKAQDSDPLVVRYLPSINDDVYSDNQYYHLLLQMALEKTISTHGAYELVPGAESKDAIDALKLLINDKGIDIAHTNTQRNRERVLIPVRIPLDKGIVGIRLMMKNSTNKDDFSDVRNLTDLKSYSYGQGEHWPDTEILRYNSLDVATTTEYDELFNQLSDGKIDGFPRAVFEIWDEIEAQKEKNREFAVAEDFYVYYPSAMYFFVRKDLEGVKIAERVEAGLKVAIEDGSFDKLFDEKMKPYLDKSKLEERTGIRLENPLLPEATPLDRDEYWYIGWE